MKYIPALLSLASVLNAASYTVETSVTCGITTNHEVVKTTTSDRCYAQGMDGSMALADVHAMVAGDFTESVGLDLNVFIVAGGMVHLADVSSDVLTSVFLHERVYAEASAKVTLYLATVGPIRPGVLRPEHWAGSHMGDYEVTEVGGTNPWYSYPLLSNFQLVTPFEMSLSVSGGGSILAADIVGYASDEDKWGGGASTQSFRWPRVYEADGITPVQLYWADEASASTPEPSTYALAGIGVIGLLISRSRKWLSIRSVAPSFYK